MATCVCYHRHCTNRATKVQPHIIGQSLVIPMKTVATGPNYHWLKKPDTKKVVTCIKKFHEILVPQHSWRGRKNKLNGAQEEACPGLPPLLLIL